MQGRRGCRCCSPCHGQTFLDEFWGEESCFLRAARCAVAPERQSLGLGARCRLGGGRAESWPIKSRLALPKERAARALLLTLCHKQSPLPPLYTPSFQMAPPKATKTAAEKKPAKKTTKSPAGDKKKKVKRSKARMGPSPDRLCSCAPSPRPSRARLSDWPLPPLTLCRPRATRSTSTRC